LAMGDTGVVIYSNSVFGARSNFEGGPSALAAALTGRTPRYGYHLDPKVYLIDRLPIEVKPLEVLLVAGITMAISMFATLVPSQAASSLRPVEGLRYD